MSEEIVCELLLPVPIQDLAAIVHALKRAYGQNLYMRQRESKLQIIRPKKL